MSTISRTLGASYLRRVSRWRAFRALPVILMLAIVQTNAFAAQTPSEPVRGHLELDGNVVHNTSTDWADLFTAGTDTVAPTAVSPLPSGFSSATFSRDFVPGATNDTSTYTTGSKDTLDINPGWQCAQANNLGNKVDVLNTYAVIFQNPTVASPDLLVYFGLERASNNGAGDVGFWLLQDKSVACDASGGTTTFTGHHVDGDVLLVSEFTTGGTISTIKVFVWQGTANPSNPLALKADISTPEPNCANAAPPASTIACAIVNNATNNPPAGLISTPWLTQPASNTLPKPLPAGFTAGHTLAASEFYEGALNVTAVLGTGTTPCFAKFVPDTRSSPSTTATLFDFAVASFASCPTKLVTSPTSSSTVIPATLNDSATLSGGTEPVGGTITFNLYGPTDPTCMGTAIYTQTVNVNGAGTYSTSPGFNATTAGTYQWTASYSGDNNGNQPSSSGCGTEPVTLGKPNPSVATAQNLLPNDSATVSGVTGLPTPTGTVDFKLFAPTDTTCSGTPVYEALNVALVNGSASTSNTTFLVDANNEGTYRWTVHYSGDSNYTAQDRACGSEQFTADITN
jgi:hypothetical protein